MPGGAAACPAATGGRVRAPAACRPRASSASAALAAGIGRHYNESVGTARVSEQRGCRSRCGLRLSCMDRRVPTAASRIRRPGLAPVAGLPGPAWPGVAGSISCQPCKESKHGNEEKSEESCEEEDRQEGQEEEGWKTQSGKEASEKEAGFAQEARKEKGGPQGRQEKSCEETRQEEGGAGSHGQASGEIRGASIGGSTCCSVGCGGARGKNCPESRCCLAVPDRVTALGGSRIVCGRALCRQSPNRRHSAPTLPVPRPSPTGRRHFTSRPAARPRRGSPKIFLLCIAIPPDRQVPDSTLLFRRLTEPNPFIRLRFSEIPQRRHQLIAHWLGASPGPVVHRVRQGGGRAGQGGPESRMRLLRGPGFRGITTSCPTCPAG